MFSFQRTDDTQKHVQKTLAKTSDKINELGKKMIKLDEEIMKKEKDAEEDLLSQRAAVQKKLEELTIRRDILKNTTGMFL